MEKWEYKVIAPEAKFKGWINKKLDITIEQNLNDLGNDGWELICAIPYAGNTTTAWGAGTGNFVFIFKRRRG